MTKLNGLTYPPALLLEANRGVVAGVKMRQTNPETKEWEIQAWPQGVPAPTPEQWAAWDAAFAPPAIVTYEELRARLTAAERQAILSSPDWRVRDFTLWASANNRIDLNGANAAEAKALLVALGLLTPSRAAEVFAATP